MYKKERVFDLLLIVTFIVGLFLPLILTHNRDVSSIEKRKLQPFPELNWERTKLTTFPSQFEAFFNDHFGLRDNFAQLYYILSLKLKSSPNPNVLIGQDDWLFYINPNDGNSLEDYRKNDPLTPLELKQWRTVLEAKNSWLNQQGIHYLFIVSPDKQSIYGEYFPARIHQVGKQSRFDQLLEYMHDSEVPILDLRPSLIQAKAKGLLYFKTDTHWNDFGAAVAQYEIIRYLAKYDSTLHPHDYSVGDFSFFQFSGDIANMLNLSSHLKEIAPQLRKPYPLCNRQFVEERPDDPQKATFFNECRTDAPQVLIFRDSFFESIEPFISPHLSKSLYVWICPDFNQLEQYLEYLSADMVIEERVERALKNIPALPTPQNKAYHAFYESWFNKGVTVYQLKNHGHDDLIGIYQLTITPYDQFYKLVSQGSDPQFQLSEFKWVDTLQYIMKIDLKAPQATTWQIFYGTSDQPQYNEGQSISGQLQPGENVFYAVIDNNKLQGQIRIDPGMVVGEYVLKSLEIRAVKR